MLPAAAAAGPGLGNPRATSQASMTWAQREKRLEKHRSSKSYGLTGGEVVVVLWKNEEVTLVVVVVALDITSVQLIFG